MGKTFNSRYSSGSGRTYSDSDPQWFFKESPEGSRLKGGDMPYYHYRSFGGSDDVGVYGNADVENGGSKKFPKSRINNGKCFICGKSQCMGKDERGFGMHGGTCNYCGKEDCTGDDNRGFSVHLIDPEGSYYHYKPRPEPKPKPWVGHTDAPPTIPETEVEEPKKVYFDEKDALKDMLNSQGKRTDDYPIEYSPEALEFLKKSNVIVLPPLDEETPDRMVFNAAKFDLEPDFDDPEYRQEEHTDSFESGEPEQIDTEDDEDEDEEVGTTSFEPSTLPEHPEEAIHELKNDYDDDDYEEEHHLSSDDDGNDSDEDEEKPVPIRKTAPLPKKFKKPSNAIATEETSVEHDPSSESFEEDEETTPSGFTPSADKPAPRKTTIAIPNHGVQGPDVISAMMYKHRIDNLAKHVVNKSDREGTDFSTTIKNVQGDLDQAKKDKQADFANTQKAIDEGRAFGDGNAVTHSNCGCDKLNGFETRENIAKIKASDEYKNGIKSINSQPETSDDDLRAGLPSKRDKIDQFIADSYRCKGDPK